MINLNQGTLSGLTIQVPPLIEQRAIATALSDVDALLAKLDQLLAKKRDLKQAAMQELLTGKRRLPGFVGEWEASTLGLAVEGLEAIDQKRRDRHEWEYEEHLKGHSTIVAN